MMKNIASKSKLALCMSLKYLWGIAYHQNLWEISASVNNYFEQITTHSYAKLYEKGKNVGVIRGVHGKFGIGLCRMQECLSAQKLTVFGDIQVTVTKPTWWPQVAPKTSRPQEFS